MTATTARLLPVQPGKVRNAMLNAMGRHGVSRATAEAIFYDLTTGQDPRPANVPETIVYRGIRIDWPRGRHTRALHPSEVKQINRGLRAAGKALSSSSNWKDELLDNEDNAHAGRVAVEALLRHMGEPSYNPEPVREEALRELVAEATEARREDNAPILWEESVPLLTGTPDEPVVHEPVVHVLTCGFPGPFDGVSCTLAHHDDAEHEGSGYAWSGAQIEREFDTDPAVAHVEGLCWRKSPRGRTIHCFLDKGHAGQHDDGTRKWNDAGAKSDKRAKVQVVITPTKTVAAQVIEPEPVSDDLDTLLADIAALNVRLGL